MPWVRFLADFDFRPPEKPRCHVAYKTGMVQLVRRVCAEEALAIGRAVEVERPTNAGSEILRKRNRPYAPRYF